MVTGIGDLSAAVAAEQVSIAPNNQTDMAANQPPPSTELGDSDTFAVALNTDVGHAVSGDYSLNSMEFQPSFNASQGNLGNTVMERLNTLSDMEAERKSVQKDGGADYEVQDVSMLSPGPASAPLAQPEASSKTSEHQSFFENQMYLLERSYSYSIEISMVSKIASNLSGNIQGLLTRN